MAEDKTTVLEGIISDVAVALYQRWANELPEEPSHPCVSPTQKDQHRFEWSCKSRPAILSSSKPTPR